MRYFIYFLFIFLTSVSCSLYYSKQMKIKNEFIPVKPPNKPIKEIRFDIWYQPKHTEEEKRQVTIDYNDCLFRHQDKENPHESCKYIQVREEDRIRLK